MSRRGCSNLGRSRRHPRLSCRPPDRRFTPSTRESNGVHVWPELRGAVDDVDLSPAAFVIQRPRFLSIFPPIDLRSEGTVTACLAKIRPHRRTAATRRRPSRGYTRLEHTEHKPAPRATLVFGSITLGGHLKTGHRSTLQNRPPHTWRARRSEFYRRPSWERKSVCSLVRQLRGPHLSTCAWWRRRSRSAVTAAVSPRSFPQSSTGLFDVSSVDARS